MMRASTWNSRLPHGGQRLVDLVRDRHSNLPEHRKPRRVREIRLQLLKPILGANPVCYVDSSAKTDSTPADRFQPGSCEQDVDFARTPCRVKVPSKIDCDLGREKNRLHKLLDDAGIKLGGVVSDIDGACARKMAEGLTAGIHPRSPRARGGAQDSFRVSTFLQRLRRTSSKCVATSRFTRTVGNDLRGPAEGR
jgi:hypothetical protein